MRSVTAFCGVALVWTALAGCRGEAPWIEGDQELVALEKTAKAAKPHPARLALAPVVLPVGAKGDLEKDPSRFPAKVDRAKVQAGLAKALGATTGFAAPRLLDAGAAASHDAALASAFAGREDILIRPVFRRLECAYRGHNARWVPNMLLFVYLWAPSFWVADEDFALEGDLELEYYSVASERLLHSKRVRIDHEWPLDDFERGWSWTGIVSVPATIEESDWALVAETFTPAARYYLERHAVLETAKLPEVLKADAVQKKDRTVFALACGISKFKGRIPGPAAAAADAQGFATWLRTTAGVPKKNIATLTDRAATGEDVEKAILGHLGRARPDDTVVLYWSGVGAVAGPERQHFLVPHDADPDGGIARTGLSFARLRQLLDRVPAKNVVVIVDAAFDAPRAGGRSLPAEQGGAAGTAEFEKFSVKLSDRKDILLIVAAGPGEDAIELDGAGRGLLSYLVETGAAGVADTDRNGTVSGGELQAFLETHVASQAGLDGATQRPRFYREGRAVTPLDPANRPAFLPNAELSSKVAR